MGWLKCNTDAAFVSQKRRGSTGLAFREHGGQVRAMATRPLQAIVSPFHTEFLALFEGTKMAEGLGYNRTDCSVLAAVVNQAEGDISMFRFVLDDLKAHLQNHVEFKVVFAPCEANKVAYTLATKALNASVSQHGLVHSK
ncbi:uncharacterized protein LOC121052883 [Rosa chinensis]|uniref:uncharacterized protein LOC121052883 n=1 Tax=Rosa chinensis TaxID=74649 RepID=UPI001AD92F87|nr:uncharacterized protein LOC121052883 [Rosa chinensis]